MPGLWSLTGVLLIFIDDQLVVLNIGNPNQIMNIRCIRDT